MQVMYFMPCTDPNLVRGLTSSLLAQTIYICSNSRSCCCKYTPDKCSSERRDLDL